MKKSAVFEDLHQYPIEREDFRIIFDKAEDLFWDIYPYENDEFKTWRYDDEFYILHKPSGTLVNWYKHLGRTNTCNKDLTLDQYKEFVEMFMESVNPPFRDPHELDEDVEE